MNGTTHRLRQRGPTVLDCRSSLRTVTRRPAALRWCGPPRSDWIWSLRPATGSCRGTVEVVSPRRAERRMVAVFWRWNVAGLDRARCGHQMTFPQGPTRRTWDPGTAAGRAAFPAPCPGSLVFARTLPAMDDETNDPCWRPPSHDGDALQNLRARGALVITRLDRLGLSSSAPWSPSAPRSANATSACALCAVRWLTFGNRDGCLRSDHRVGHPARGGTRAGRVRVAASPDQVAGRASPSGTPSRI